MLYSILVDFRLLFQNAVNLKSTGYEDITPLVIRLRAFVAVWTSAHKQQSVQQCTSLNYSKISKRLGAIINGPCAVGMTAVQGMVSLVFTKSSPIRAVNFHCICLHAISFNCIGYLRRLATHLHPEVASSLGNRPHLIHQERNRTDKPLDPYRRV